MMWGICSQSEMGPLIRLDITLTGDTYIHLLADHLHPFMSIVHSDGFGQFQQGNATSHTSRIAREWLQWPSNSPHMNIIEHIWDALQCAVQKKSSFLILLWIYLQPCRMHGVNSPQHYFRHQSSPCHIVLRHFCMLVRALHDIRQLYPFLWLFSV